MGVLYSVIPVDGAEEMERWLKRVGVVLPSELQTSRNPTPHEIRQTLDGINGHTVRYLIGDTYWQADIFKTPIMDGESSQQVDGPSALLNIIDFQGDEHQVDHF